MYIISIILFLTIKYIHVYNVYMQRMQILFSEPQLFKLRQLAESQDRPVSELIRAAVDFYLLRQSAEADSVTDKAPVYSCGEIKSSADILRDIANEKS